MIKVGSAVLTSSEQGLDQNRIERLASDISAIMAQGREVVLVSSGAIAAGLAKLGLKKTKGMPLSLKQAAAAIGQSGLMWMYEKTFGTHGKKVAQVLLTREDLSNRTRFLNARNTLQTLFDYGVVPIINENDTVSVDEIKFGDNDNLSSMVVHLTDADLLVILSDIDGLYTADPKNDPSAVLIPLVEKITAEIERCAGDSHTSIGTGGMRSKTHDREKGRCLRRAHGDREREEERRASGVVRRSGSRHAVSAKAGQAGQPETLDRVHGLLQRQGHGG